MSINKWHEDIEQDRSQYIIDKRFKRRIFKFGPFALWETIRIIQYYQHDDPKFRYFRGVGISEKHMDIKMYESIYRFLNLILKKGIEIENIRNSTKYLKKYRFVADLFKDIKRSRLLEELGI
jgi:hypothetical protein